MREEKKEERMIEYSTHLSLHFKLVNHAPYLVMGSGEVLFLSCFHPLLDSLVLLSSLALPAGGGILNEEITT